MIVAGTTRDIKHKPKTSVWCLYECTYYTAQPMLSYVYENLYADPFFSDYVCTIINKIMKLLIV